MCLTRCGLSSVRRLRLLTSDEIVLGCLHASVFCLCSQLAQVLRLCDLVPNIPQFGSNGAGVLLLRCHDAGLFLVSLRGTRMRQLSSGNARLLLVSLRCASVLILSGLYASMLHVRIVNANTFRLSTVHTRVQLVGLLGSNALLLGSLDAGLRCMCLGRTNASVLSGNDTDTCVASFVGTSVRLLSG